MKIIVPYRDRPAMLAEFIPAMKKYLPGSEIVIVSQVDNKPFNRAKLINVGYLETKPDFFVSHDIDLIPLKVDYSPRKGITQLASNPIQRVGYLSGATMFSSNVFELCGGYHNDYFSRGEDNEFSFNLLRLGIPVIYRIGEFRELPHERTGPEFIPELWKKAQEPRVEQNQLSICKYQVKRSKKKFPFTLIQVEL